MKALALTTRFIEHNLQGNACLLVYDVAQLSGAAIGEDVRDILDRQPNTLRFYVLAPFLNHALVKEALLQGSALKRAGITKDSTPVEISSITIHKEGSQVLIKCNKFFLESDRAVQSTSYDLPPEILEGWLFHLFDMNSGLVNAPIGVHFGKLSSKHSSKFLRTSSVLLSSEACGAIAFFSLAALTAIEPRRIFVDTAPLLSVAFAMQRITQINKIWEQMPPAKSFSSYGGVSNLPTLSKSDVLLISASTSGGLAKRLVDDFHVDEGLLLTLYLLKSSDDMKTHGRVLCDLTGHPKRLFGYSVIDNHAPSECELCKKGYVLAQLEGDQFLLEKRAVKRLRMGAASQIGTARADLEGLTRTNSIATRLYRTHDSKTNIEINLNEALSVNGFLCEKFSYLLRRHAPSAVAYVIAVGMSTAEANSYCQQAGLYQGKYKSIKFVSDDELDQLKAKPNVNALVLIGALCDHARLRGVNVQLRSLVDGGCVTYISALTIADSARNYEDLRIFLSYGEHGAETFAFRSALTVMLPWLDMKQQTSWQQELALWERLQNSATLPKEFENRLRWLKKTSSATLRLFLEGYSGELSISPDFVLLNTKKKIKSISQSDVYAVVCNALAAERSNRTAFDPKPIREKPTPVWTQTVYNQTLLCPSNFRDFNDAILRAALLRSANIQELNYTIDEISSEEMLFVIEADIRTWKQGRGDALPEFLLSMACQRLRLMPLHTEQLQRAISTSTLPSYLKLLAKTISK